MATTASPARTVRPIVRQGDAYEDIARLLLRLTLGVLMLLHGISKITGGIDPILASVGKAGLPPQLGYLVYVGEVLAPLLLIIGAWSRAAALVVVVNMLVAVGLMHSGDLFTLSKEGGWALELQGFYLVMALAVMMLGAGRYSAGGVDGRLN